MLLMCTRVGVEQRHPKAPTTSLGSISSLLDAVDLVEQHKMQPHAWPSSHAAEPTARPGPIFSDYSSSITDDDQEALPRHGKASRKRIDPGSVKILTGMFEAGIHFPSRDQREHLARKLSLPARTIQIWFQNRRQAYRNKRQTELYMKTQQEQHRLSVSSSLSGDDSVPVLMTKLKLDKAASQLVESKSVLKMPAYLSNSQPTMTLKLPSQKIRRWSDPTADTRFRFSIEALTRNDVVLPRPPRLSQFSPLMKNLPTRLPDIAACEEEHGSSTRLPSICHALRRFSLY